HLHEVGPSTGNINDFKHLDSILAAAPVRQCGGELILFYVSTGSAKRCANIQTIVNLRLHSQSGNFNLEDGVAGRARLVGREPGDCHFRPKKVSSSLPRGITRFCRSTSIYRPVVATNSDFMR